MCFITAAPVTTTEFKGPMLLVHPIFRIVSGTSTTPNSFSPKVI